MPAVLTETQNTVEWLGLRLVLPRPWEIVRHGVSGRKGSLAFADRRRQRLQVTWTNCVKRPDVARLLSDHRDRQKSIDADAVFVTPTLPVGWRGLERRFAVPPDSTDGPNDTPGGRGEGESAILVRAARYDDATDRLIEVVLDRDPREAADATLAAEVLAGLRVVCKPDEARRLNAFGIDADLPAGWRLHRTAVRPADVALTLVPRNTPLKADPSRPLPRYVTLRRRAMADVWFNGDWRALFQRDHPKSTLQVDDGEPAEARWDLPGPRYERLLKRHRVGVARAWFDPEGEAVYDMTAVGPAKAPPTLDGFVLGASGPGEGRCALG